VRTTLQLYEYLIQENLSQTDFAKQIKISQPTLSRYLNADTIPSVVNAIIIEKATHGQVPCACWGNLKRKLKQAFKDQAAVLIDE
tara:strand:- start:1402 stop:1656 length:255 start_codon:yes stop_codon:yes gene_type:complete